jgi:hypothetical protein
MRHGKLDLDLSTEEFLTDPTINPHPHTGNPAHLAVIHAGDHIVRDGHADHNWTKGEGHPGGRPLRIALDRFSGKMFVRIAEHLPHELSSSKLEQRHDHMKKVKPFHVPGSGYWLPLDEVYPNHPHVATFNS